MKAIKDGSNQTMSKYEEIQDAHQSCMNRFSEAKDECRVLVAKFLRGYIQYLGCESQQAWCFDFNDGDLSKKESPWKALRLEPDGL